MVEILEAGTGKVISRSKNLRGILRHATKHGVREFGIMANNWPNDINCGGELMVTFGDNSSVATAFADFRVLTQWVAGRRSWRGARFWVNGHNLGPFTAPMAKVVRLTGTIAEEAANG